MYRLSFVLVAAFVSLSALSQTTLLKQRKFPRDIPAGNYSGVTPLGNGRFAVVNDKSAEDGFYIFSIDIDSLSNCIRSARNEGFVSSGKANSDLEAIAFCPNSGTIFMASEAKSEVLEYNLTGQPTGRSLPLPAVFKKASENCGIESLTFGHQRFYVTTERPLPGDSLLRIQSFDSQLKCSKQYLYRPDGQTLKKGYWGVSELCALNDGRLLILEREIRVPKLKIGAQALVKIYATRPAEADTLQKELLCQFKTRLTLTSRRFANYEGMCEARPGLLLLIADSQNRYKGFLRDWLLTISL